ncbi:MAG: NAD-dependent epimerase/dehydratase family protein [Fibrobacteria bacterium]|nr:NAD-dependent epimerase/dehydratase family protein [Fibrobacteria bacterium]
MNIAIIGAGGYIGKNIFHYLKNAKKFTITCYGKYTDNDFFEDQYYYLDLNKKDMINKIDWPRFDRILYLAGYNSPALSFEKIYDYFTINCLAVSTILLKIANHATEFIYISTRLVYNEKDNYAYESIRENETTHFLTPYAISKFAAEEVIRTYSNYYNIKSAVFRLCVPYGNLIKGPVDFSYGTMGMFIKNARSGKNIVLYGNGDQMRTFTHIEFLCKSLVNKIKDKFDVYNLPGEKHSLKKVASIIAAKYKVEIDFVDWPKESLLLESGNTIFNDEKYYTTFSHKYDYSIETYYTKNE